MKIYKYGIIKNEDYENEYEEVYIRNEERIKIGTGNYIIKAPSLDDYDGVNNEDNY